MLILKSICILKIHHIIFIHEYFSQWRVKIKLYWIYSVSGRNRNTLYPNRDQTSLRLLRPMSVRLIHCVKVFNFIKSLYNVENQNWKRHRKKNNQLFFRFKWILSCTRLIFDYCFIYLNYYTPNLIQIISFEYPKQNASTY